MFEKKSHSTQDSANANSDLLIHEIWLEEIRFFSEVSLSC